MTLTFRSFCSGIGAPECAWTPLGMRCLSVCEMDAQASAVLAARCGGVDNFGDMTSAACMEAVRDGERADVFVAGTPCQSFSVAGLRKGMADPRGSLALVFLGLVDAGRPKWVVWENVPGVLSSNGGRDFGAFLGGLAELGYGFAYRVLDAQFVRVESHARAVPQRRRRVFVVGHLGSWQRAAAVLLERASMCGHPAPGREAGKSTAGTLESRTCAGGFPGTDGACAGFMIPSVEVANAMQARDAKGVNTTLDVPLLAGESCGVRRLTPRECERLQGFPDDYTLVDFKGKPMSDAARYRMLGNSMAVNVMSWIGRRLLDVAAITREAVQS